MNEYERLYEILTTSLGLKTNDNVKWAEEQLKINFTPLLSAYKKMIETDNDEFFIDKNRKQSIIDSLSNSLAFLHIQESNHFIQLLENLNENDPTSFLIIPILFPINFPSTSFHTSGLIIHKQENKYIVTNVDKSMYFSLQSPAAYMSISVNDKHAVAYFAQELFYNRRYDPSYFLPLELLHKIVLFSEEKAASPLNISMAKQHTGNCFPTELEAAFKIALFNCKQNIFSHPNNQPALKPKWNPSPDSTLEMRKRLLEALIIDVPQEHKQLFISVFNDFYVHLKTHPLKEKLKKRYASLEKIKIKLLYNPYNIYYKFRYFILKRKYQKIQKKIWWNQALRDDMEPKNRPVLPEISKELPERSMPSRQNSIAVKKESALATISPTVQRNPPSFLYPER
ncbi:hypothetical protein MCG01_06635 [Enterococcus hirae]|nr:hypothetical protein [Enterococcus hirae]